MKGTGFTRQTYSTTLVFDPPLATDENPDVSFIVYNRTHLKVTLLEGKKWVQAPSSSGTSLKIASINTGAGSYPLGTTIAIVKPDDEDHPSGVVVARSNLVLYQTAAIKKLVITGFGFTADTVFTFSPALTKDVDYTQQYIDTSTVILSLRKHKKWRYSAGSLLVKSVYVNSKTVPPPCV